MKRTIRLTESELRGMINEAVKGALNEGPYNSETYNKYEKEFLEARQLLYKAEGIIFDLLKKSHTIGGDGDTTMKAASSKYEDGLSHSYSSLENAIRYFEGYFRGQAYDAECFNDAMNN